MILQGSESIAPSRATQPSLSKEGLEPYMTRLTDTPITEIPYVFIPGRYTNKLIDNRFNGRETPTALLREAMTFSSYITSETDEIDNPQALQDQIEGDIKIARREHDQYAEVIMPHLDWGQTTLLDVLIRDLNLPKKRVLATDLDHRTANEFDESNENLAFRRETQKRGLEYAIRHVQEESLLTTFEQILAANDGLSKHETLAALGKKEVQIDNPEHTKLQPETTQALAAIDAVTYLPNETNTPGNKESMLNLALDIATNSMDTLPEGSSLDGAGIYLAASRAIHDLAVTPGSFERYVPEAEAREFRVRALELANDWIHKAAKMYRDLFDQPIGLITPNNVREIQNTAETVNAQARHINDAFWFEGVFNDEYQKAVRDLDQTTIRSIGEKAIMRLLRPDYISESTQVPRGAGLVIAA